MFKCNLPCYIWNISRFTSNQTFPLRVGRQNDNVHIEKETQHSQVDVQSRRGLKHCLYDQTQLIHSLYCSLIQWFLHERLDTFLHKWTVL